MAPLKRKRNTNAQAPIKHFHRSPSIISIPSSDENEAPKIPSSSQASAEYWSQQPDLGSDISDEELLASAQKIPILPSDPPESGPVGDDNGPAGVDSVPEPTLCKEQQDLLDLIMAGRNVFFTGSAGCGKSTVLKAAVKKLRERHKTVHIVAPTGRAALGVNGTTTWSYMGWTPRILTYPLEKLKGHSWNDSIEDRIKKTDVLIIDEISMVENHHLERMNVCMKHIRCYNDPHARAFGGVQVIVTGDFCQLPPVKPFQNCMYCGARTIKDHDRQTTEWNCHKNDNKEEYDLYYPWDETESCGPFYIEDQWAFRSRAWQEANFTHVHLYQIHRQNDQDFIKMLQKCRLGIPFETQELKILLDHPYKPGKAVELHCTNYDVNNKNHEEFVQLRTPQTNYQAKDRFRYKGHEELEKYGDRLGDGTLEACKEHPLDAMVKLKKDALVMLRVNLDIKNGLVNGSQGIVRGWEPFDPAKLPKKKNKSGDSDSDSLGGEFATYREEEISEFTMTQGVRQWPIVEFHNGLTRTIYPTCVVNALGATSPYSLLSRTQVPLTLAWAVSVHKSQGMTLDLVKTKLDKAWEQAQKYVALSRVTTLEGLQVDGDEESLHVIRGGNPEVREFLLEKFGRDLFKQLEESK